MADRILEIKNLSVAVLEQGKEKFLVDGVNLEIPQETIVALVGGSGSGKTTTGLSILRLLPTGLNIKNGTIIFNGKDLLSLKEEEMRRVRGKSIGMIFQEPLSALNPLMAIHHQIEEVLAEHTALDKGQRVKRVLELLNLVEVPEPRRIAGQYPHQLSGGLRQRAMIAQAIAAQPKLIIADEPTSNLDVTIQAKVMDLFRKLKKEFKLSILLISHDLGMVGHLADQVAVMDRGRIIEWGTTSEILKHPQHEYTNQLIEAI